MEWSPKQASFIKHSDAFLNVADGAVRSGKTHSNLTRFAEYCVQGPAGDLGVFGRTERTVKRNVVIPLTTLFPGAIKHVQGSGELFVFGRRCWLFGANDVRAEEKVQGSTLAGGYMNEVTLYPRPLFEQAISRSMTIRGAQWFMDCNPNSPYHWLYADYLTAEHPKDYLKRWRFQLRDNPILPQENIDMLKALYGPGSLFYRRNIDGEWVVAEGAIYDMFREDVHVVHTLPERFEQYVVGVDYGTANATVFLLLGKSMGKWYVISEWRHDSRKTGSQMTDMDYSIAFFSWLHQCGVVPSSVEVDPSAASFKLQLKKDGLRIVHDANNDVIDGIRNVATALSMGQLFVHASCRELIAEMANYRWDERAQLRGEDKPVKEADHGPDALRYAIQRIYVKRGTRKLRVIR